MSESASSGPDMIWVVIVVGGLLVMLFLFAWVMFMRYRKVGPNEALIITGRKSRLGHYRVVTGGATFILPTLEEARLLSLEVTAIPDRAGSVEGVAQFRIKSDLKSIASTAERFMSKRPEEIGDVVAEIPFSHLRDAAGGQQMDPSGIESKVKSQSESDLAPLGPELASFTLKEPTRE